ncbi:DUF2515 family protein [Peribacillus kribbensis]|uniref:DUF2515 family protein n=1 Tax=Peribacillus kribbensis TaxID=356658 RepID=UPI0006849744|nr:DUF2515 family protein [Peribacillus kribbensis]
MVRDHSFVHIVSERTVKGVIAIFPFTTLKVLKGKLFGGQENRWQEVMGERDFSQLRESLKEELKREPDIPVLHPEEEEIKEHVENEVRKLNANNLTRTMGYLDYFKRNPEVHWAFLAHMVSRNGGYHMTDLKGSMMDHLLKESERDKYFAFLERANGGIFADAYPQLHLYELSKNRAISFRRLFPHFRISRFMIPVWEAFSKSGNREMLTVGMILNEQRMLQERVVKRSWNAELLSRIDFQLQEFFGFTAVIFPYVKRKGSKYRLAGLTVNRFERPEGRIMTGKLLYSMLFLSPKVLKGTQDFAFKNVHTASRSDYWEELFTRKRRDDEKIYSPVLSDAWEDRPFMPPPGSDWFITNEFIEDIRLLPVPLKTDLTDKASANVKHIKTINEVKSII